MTDMKKSRFTEEQIIGFLKQAGARCCSAATWRRPGEKSSALEDCQIRAELRALNTG